MDITLDSIRDIKLYQPKTGYRFSVDALLLYDFVNLGKINRIADLGAGSGIVGILLATKYPDATVALFEIQERLVLLAEKNIILNSLEGRVRVIKKDIRKIKNSHSPYAARHYYDLVVSNPPFRVLKSGRMSVGEERAIARHEVKLTLDELVDTGSFLLREKGRFCIIYHPSRTSELIGGLKKRGLEPKRLRFVHSNISSEAKMVLVEAAKGGKKGLKVEKPLFIYNDDGSYSDEMREIFKNHV
ncbi:MAG: tRNA1(Val) (adenine(37)-N6)-methyltransferase [Nitrospirota bacterium]